MCSCLYDSVLIISKCLLQESKQGSKNRHANDLIIWESLWVLVVKWNKLMRCGVKAWNAMTCPPPFRDTSPAFQRPWCKLLLSSISDSRYWHPLPHPQRQGTRGEATQALIWGSLKWKGGRTCMDMKKRVESYVSIPPIPGKRNVGGLQICHPLSRQKQKGAQKSPLPSHNTSGIGKRGGSPNVIIEKCQEER